MGLREELQGITEDELIETMRADAAQFEYAEAGHRSFPEYLRDEYPELLDFIITSTDMMPFDSEAEFGGFQMGSSYTAAAICRAIDSRDLRQQAGALPIPIDRVGMQPDLLFDPTIFAVVTSVTQALGENRENMRAQFLEIGSDPNFADLYLRSNQCMYCVYLAERLQQQGIAATCLINEGAVLSQEEQSMVTFNDRRDHVVLSVTTSSGQEVIIDPFYSQFLSDFGLTIDLVAKIGDERVFPREFVLVYTLEQQPAVSEWAAAVVQTFWARVNSGDLRGMSDVFTARRSSGSVFLDMAGQTRNPVCRVSNAELVNHFDRIWARENYRQLTENDLKKIQSEATNN